MSGVQGQLDKEMPTLFHGRGRYGRSGEGKQMLLGGDNRAHEGPPTFATTPSGFALTLEWVVFGAVVVKWVWGNAHRVKGRLALR